MTLELHFTTPKPPLQLQNVAAVEDAGFNTVRVRLVTGTNWKQSPDGWTTYQHVQHVNLTPAKSL